MKNAFLSEWVKLRRPSILLGSAGAMAAFVALANFGFIRAASIRPNPARPGSAERFGALADLVASPAGAVRGLVATTTLIGLVVLGVFASNVGNEYKQGTLRFLLVGEPRRLRLLGGKLLALASLAMLASFAALVVGVVTGKLFAAMFGVSTSSWLTGEGLRVMASTYTNVALACIGWGLLGSLLAIVMRASTAAIITGVVYLMVGERLISQAILGSVVDLESAWFPGEVLGAFAAGGSLSSSYVRSALMVALYAGVMIAGGFALFSKRDVLH